MGATVCPCPQHGAPSGHPGLSAGLGARVLLPARSLSPRGESRGLPCSGASWHRLFILPRAWQWKLPAVCLLMGVGEPRPARPPAPGRGSGQGARGSWVNPELPSCSSRTTLPRALSQTRAPVPRRPHPQPSVSVARTAPQLCPRPSVNLANSWLGPHCAPGTLRDEEVLPQGPRPKAQGSRLGTAAGPVPRPSQVFICVCCSFPLEMLPPNTPNQLSHSRVHTPPSSVQPSMTAWCPFLKDSLALPEPVGRGSCPRQGLGSPVRIHQAKT